MDFISATLTGSTTGAAGGESTLGSLIQSGISTGAISSKPVHGHQPMPQVNWDELYQLQPQTNQFRSLIQ